MRTETFTRAMQVCLGEHAIAVGTLTYSRRGARENTLFVYDDAWLENDSRFEISPDLPLTRERYFHKAATRSDSVFHFAIADTEPDGWGCKVIARDHAKRRKAGQAGESVALTEMDYLLGGKIEDALRAASYFHLTDEGALRILGEVHSAVSRWRQVARGAVVGMSAAESEAFEAAFEHEETRSAKRRLA